MLSEPREALEAVPRTSRFTLTAGKPALIDLTTTYQNGSTALYTKGIVEIQDDSLRYCIAAPGLPRPDLFATGPGDEKILVTLHRMNGMPSPPFGVALMSTLGMFYLGRGFFVGKRRETCEISDSRGLTGTSEYLSPGHP